MNDLSRGLFDWTCKPSGSVTCTAARAMVPARTVSRSTMAVSSAFGRRACAWPATVKSAPPQRTQRTRRSKPGELFTSIDLAQRDRPDWHRDGRRIDLAFDRRKILEHEIPLPPLGRVR